MDHAHWWIQFTSQIVFMVMLEKVAGIHFAVVGTGRTVLFLAMEY